MSDILLFANPISGRGRGRVLAGRIERSLIEAGYGVETHLEPPGELRAESLPAEVRAAIVIGGDGTLRTVAGTLLKLRGEVPPLIPVPVGTANLMGRYLRIRRLTAETTVPWVRQALENGEIESLDVAQANGQLVLLMAGIGFDAEVVHEMGRRRRGPIQYASYVLPTARALGSYRFVALRVIADGKEVFPRQPGIAFVGNASEYGTGFPVLPLARPDDRLLDVCVLPCKSRTELLQWCFSIVAGQHLDSEGTVYLRAKRVEIDSVRPMPIQIDGDPAGYTPVTIDLLPTRLRFMVPREPEIS